MISALATTLVLAAFIVAVMVLPVYGIIKVFGYLNRHRKSPLNIEMLRSPGQTLREEISDVTLDLTGYLLMIPALIVTSYAVDLSNKYYLGKGDTKVSTLSILIICVVSCAVFIYRSFKLFAHRNRLRLGYELNFLTWLNLLLSRQ